MGLLNISGVLEESYVGVYDVKGALVRFSDFGSQAYLKIAVARGRYWESTEIPLDDQRDEYDPSNRQHTSNRNPLPAH